MKLKIIIQSMRGPFLILTPVCVFLGVSTVVSNHGTVNIFMLLLVLLGALFAHIGVNTLNEHHDFNSGLDFATIKTPFSGGSGALPQNPEMAHAVFKVGIASLVATTVIGIFFVWEYGFGIIPIGLLGLVLMVTYTGWINKHPILCLIAPGIGFGFLMVAGTQFVLEGGYSNLSWLVAVVPFFLVNNLLLLNQYPDIKADAKAGRNHLPIAFGVATANKVYAFFVLATVIVIITYIAFNLLPLLSLIALLPIPLALFSLKGAIKHTDNIGNFPQYLAANVAVTILTPLLLGISLILG